MIVRYFNIGKVVFEVVPDSLSQLSARGKIKVYENPVDSVLICKETLLFGYQDYKISLGIPSSWTKQDEGVVQSVCIEIVSKLFVVLTSQEVVIPTQDTQLHLYVSDGLRH